MTTFRSEEGLAGLIALGVIPWIVWTLHRGLKLGRLPIGRAYVRRDERPRVFVLVFAFHTAAAMLMVAIMCDLLLGLDIRTLL